LIVFVHAVSAISTGVLAKSAFAHKLLLTKLTYWLDYQ
jgi:hypothetical protein